MRDKLRAIKVNPEDDRVPTMTEIALVPQRDIPGIVAAGHTVFLRSLSTSCIVEE
jgi:hypothetical protein